jgi:hypothetical protein
MKTAKFVLLTMAQVALLATLIVVASSAFSSTDDPTGNQTGNQMTHLSLKALSPAPRPPAEVKTQATAKYNVRCSDNLSSCEGNKSSFCEDLRSVCNEHDEN